MTKCYRFPVQATEQKSISDQCAKQMKEIKFLKEDVSFCILLTYTLNMSFLKFTFWFRHHVWIVTHGKY